MQTTRALGIDVGGSGIKGALVDLRRGTLISDRYRIKTPEPSTPRALSHAVARIVRHFNWKGPIGCGMPGPIKDGKVLALANLHKSWIGVRAADVFTKACGRRVRVVNDADAAGLAEMRFGVGKGIRGSVVILTLGTGIGSSVFTDGMLIPNCEFGQMEMRGKPAEQRAAARVRKEKGLSWEQWGKRLNVYLLALENVLWPDLIILGGGVSRRAAKFVPFVTTRARVVPAHLKNEAGIIGAALWAVRKHHALP